MVVCSGGYLEGPKAQETRSLDISHAPSAGVHPLLRLVPAGCVSAGRSDIHEAFPARGRLAGLREGWAGVQGGRKPQSMSRLVAPAARPAVRTDWSRARGEQAQRYVAECHRPSVRGKHVHIARAERTNGPCRLRLLQPDCWQTMSSHPAAGRGGRGSVARRRLCGWHVGSGHAGPVARTRLARRRPRSATGYSRGPACRSLS